MPNRHALLILIGLCIILWGLARACAPHPATSQPGSSATWPPGQADPRGRLYLPLTADVRGPGRVCSATWAGAAWYSARHCLPPNPLLLRVDGAPVTAWQADASGRDVAQVVAGTGGAAPAMAILAPGDVLDLRPARGSVPATYAGAGWGDSTDAGYLVETAPYPGARALGIACADPAAPVLIGDSGGGAYRVEGGGLGGIIVAAEARADDADAWCGVSQSVVLEVLP